MAAAIARHLLGPKFEVMSCGVRASPVNPFVIAAMEEIGIDVSDHQPHRFSDLENPDFDAIISLTPEAQHQAVEFTRHSDVSIVYWPTHDPTLAMGNREQVMHAFREVRDHLAGQIRSFFHIQPTPNA